MRPAARMSLVSFVCSVVLFCSLLVGAAACGGGGGGGDEPDAGGGDDVAGDTGAQDDSAGEGEDDSAGGGEDVPTGGGEDVPTGGGEDVPTGGGEDVPTGGGEDVPTGGDADDGPDATPDDDADAEVPTEEILLGFVSTPSAVAIADEAWSYPVSVAGSGLPTLTVVEGPAGLAVAEDGQTLAWTPDDAAAGKHHVVLEATLDEAVGRQYFQIQVVVATVDKQEEIGATGGVIEPPAEAKTAGTKVTVPPGALPGKVQLGVSSLDQDVKPAALSGDKPLKPVLLTPTGTQFAEPVEVSLPYDEALDSIAAAGLVEVYVLDEKTGTWEGLEVTGIDEVARTVTFLTDHFSVFVAGDPAFQTSVEIVDQSAVEQCTREIVLQAVLQQGLEQVAADAVEMLPDPPAASVADLLADADFDGSLRVIRVVDLLDADGESIDQDAAAVTLYRDAETGSGHLAVAGSDGQIDLLLPMADVTAEWEAQAALIAGTGLHFRFQAEVNDSVGVQARTYLRAEAGDAAGLTFDPNDQGTLLTQEVLDDVTVTTGDTILDEDCDGIDDSIDPEVIVGQPELVKEPNGLVDALVGEGTTLRCYATGATDAESVVFSWSSSEATDVIGAPNADGEVTFTGTELGSRVVTCSGMWQDTELAGQFTVKVAEPVPPCGGSCDDGNPCTQDVCEADANVCLHVDVAGDCDDGDACTDGDTCLAGWCTGAPIGCDDGDVCTDDACDAGTGCVFTSNDAPCTDGNPCTDGDQCADGSCVSGANSCECTGDDDCDDDGDLCNGSLACVDNVCVVDPATVPAPCEDDGNACTTTACDPGTGSCATSALPDGAFCDDGTACTAGDSCVSGQCTGEALDCEDDNPCTVDSCHATVGCVVVPGDGDCDDGNSCTEGDFCADGECAPGANTCECTSDADCGDLDDDDACNGTLICQGNACILDAASVVTCDQDDDPCTVSACVPATGECMPANAPEGVACDDGVACTGGDACTAGACTGLPVVCGAGELCGAEGVCIPETSAAGQLNCLQTVECTEPCDFVDAECIYACADDGTATGGQLLSELYECLLGVCPDGGDDCLGPATEADCAAEWSGCVADGPACVSDADCDGDEQCGVDGLCDAGGGGDTGQCDSDADCPEGMACEDGWCKDPAGGGCETDTDCGPEEHCQDGWCVPAGCEPQCEGVECGDDGCGGDCGFCGVGMVCQADGTCAVDGDGLNCLQALECTDGCEFSDGGCIDECAQLGPYDLVMDLYSCLVAPCPEGEDDCLNEALADVCAAEWDACVADGPACVTDADCGPGKQCGGGGQCEGADGSCDSDADCPAGLYCKDGWCQDEAAQPGNCNEALNCLVGQCDLNDDGCVAGCIEAGGPVAAETIPPLAECVLQYCDGSDWGCITGVAEELCGEWFVPCQADGGCQPDCSQGCGAGDGCGGVCACDGMSCQELLNCTDPCDNPFGGPCVDECMAQGDPMATQQYGNLVECILDLCPGGDEACTDDAVSGPCAWAWEGCAGAGGGACVTDSDCGGDESCVDGKCEWLGCEASCDGIQCGDDGCGGWCGECGPGEVCSGGQCTLCECPDGGPCTFAECEPGGDGGYECVYHEEPGMPCDDGDGCTQGDYCEPALGGCVGMPVMCDDGDSCTVEGCDGNGGCWSEPVCQDGEVCWDGGCWADSGCGDDTMCDDGDPCTMDMCIDGACVHPPTCEDGNPCTEDQCDPASGECNWDGDALDGMACNDNFEACAVFECMGGECMHMGDVECDDGNPCTDDWCDGTFGCVNAPGGGGCDDGNPCTIDSCDEASGCSHEDLDCGEDAVCVDPFGCVDANPCANDEDCQAFGDACTPYACVDSLCLPVQGPCDDGDVCTFDDCEMTGGPGEFQCYNWVEDGMPCDDGDVCTFDDYCHSAFGGCVGFDGQCDDGDDCTTDWCDPAEGGCVSEALCGADEVCWNGGCYPSADCSDDSDCDDGSLCTEDWCFDGACVNPPTCGDDGECVQALCDEATGECSWNSEAFDGQPCNQDGMDLCNTFMCNGGGCEHTGSIDCDDGDMCTDDWCDPQLGCANQPSSGACDDGNACTADSCQEGECLHEPVDCGAGWVCHQEFGCLEDQFCMDDSQCGNDEDPCFLQVCEDSQCVPAGSPCDDGDPCTQNDCMPMGEGEYECMTWFEEGMPCDDGNACTEGDFCSGDGGCWGWEVTCDDGDPCTADWCDDSGCMSEALCAGDEVCWDGGCYPNSGCSDDAECASGDECATNFCIDGACVTQSICEDYNHCTIDHCDPAGQGCDYEELDCDDGDPCTDDWCDSEMGCQSSPGECQYYCQDSLDCLINTCPSVLDDACVQACIQLGGPMAEEMIPELVQCVLGPCPDGDWDCVGPAAEMDCAEWLVPCEEDKAPDGPCEPQCDGQCGDDGCGGSCGECGDGEFCAGNMCQVCECEDGDPCTWDWCQQLPEGGFECMVEPNDGMPCDDGDVCTHNDQCQSVFGGCVGEPASCNDGNECTVDSCGADGCMNEPLCAGDEVCWGGQCWAGATGCEADDAICDDSDACTSDFCQEGACVHASNCDDGNECTLDSCDPATGDCEQDFDAMAGQPCGQQWDGDQCGVYQCQDGGCMQVEEMDCEDGNPCTYDWCDPTFGCAHQEDAGNACDDQDPCTNDYCDAGAGCYWEPVDCGEGHVCTADFGCIEDVYCDEDADCPQNGNPCDTKVCADNLCVPGPGPCDDGDECTEDWCEWDGAGDYLCQSEPAYGMPCDDGDGCTQSDQCEPAFGGCIGQPVSCDDGDDCTLEGCDGAGGCWQEAACPDGDVCFQGGCYADSGCADDSGCDDSDPCTNDFCWEGACVTTPQCDDGNECTVDTCAADGTCTSDAAPLDGTECNTQGLDLCNTWMCSGGLCEHTGETDCDDGNPCTQDWCDGNLGCGHQDDQGGCDDGNGCTTDSCDPVAGCIFQPVDCGMGAVCVDPFGCLEDNPCLTDDDCTQDDNPCHPTVCVAEQCQPGPGPCDDGNPCTWDQCEWDGGGDYFCESWDDDGAPCDDGDLCTTNDTCQSAFGGCIGQTESCDDGDPCTMDACIDGACDNQPACGPDEGCWDGACYAAESCADDTGCNDGSDCTMDMCIEGACVYPSICDDSNDCTVDTCDEDTGECTHDGAPLEGTTCGSNDWDLCSQYTCENSHCNWTGDVDCDDGDPCTQDWCDPTFGCGHQPDPTCP